VNDGAHYGYVLYQSENVWFRYLSEMMLDE